MTCGQWAALNNRVAAITLLFQFGAEVDEAEPGGQTALHWAATRGALPSVVRASREKSRPARSLARQYHNPRKGSDT